MSGGLTGKVALVTGASKGIGRAIALGFAEVGASVCLVARTGGELDGLVAAAPEGSKLIAAQADVTEADSLQRAFGRCAEAFGGLDILVVNAGISTEPRTVEGSDPDSWRQTLETNLFGAYLTAKAAIPHLRQRGGGHIIVLGSGMGHRGMKGSSAYSCSKAGLSMLVKVLAEELREHGINVNELIPGPVDTGLNAAALTTIMASPEGAVEWNKQPEDILPLALFLAQQPYLGPTGQTFSLMRRILG
ncbi:MAG: SDR family NAD(P)-dependent oxidoreductase [Candidatus Methylumidiphilus sp.]